MTPADTLEPRPQVAYTPTAASYPIVGMIEEALDVLERSCGGAGGILARHARLELVAVRRHVDRMSAALERLRITPGTFGSGPICAWGDEHNAVIDDAVAGRPARTAEHHANPEEPIRGAH